MKKTKKLEGEVVIIGRILKILEPFNKSDQERILRFVWDKYSSIG